MNRFSKESWYKKSWFECPHCKNELQFRGRDKTTTQRQYYCDNIDCDKYPAFFIEDLYQPGKLIEV